MSSKQSISLTELSKEIHKNAIEHGWCDRERSLGEIIALCHSELSEALEEFRNGKPNAYVVRDTSTFPQYESCKKEITDIHNWREDEKPEGIATELADCIIRILDYCGEYNIDVDKELYDVAECGIDCIVDIKPDFADFICDCHNYLSYSYRAQDIISLLNVVLLINKWANKNNVDMGTIMYVKHKYNITRPYRHGGKRI